LNRTVIPHLLGMFVCNLAIAFSSMDALEVTIGQAAYSPMFQISRALAAVILPLVIAAERGFDLVQYPADRNWLARISARPHHVRMEPFGAWRAR